MFYMIMIQNVPWKEIIEKKPEKNLIHKEIVITAVILINTLRKIIKEWL